MRDRQPERLRRFEVDLQFERRGLLDGNTYGAMVWLLARSGRSALGATVLAGSRVLGVEVLQTWLPTRVADITDPLLVVAAGGLLALF